ncbi:MAG TPA: hypothetical protein VM598_11305, partial [Bdellovibrionota bacterium]|nr:hypothetical protein [Bdellovibrionota bacterium]
RLLSDGRRLLDLRAEDEIARVRSVLSGGEDYPIQSAEFETGSVRLRMHWVQGLSLPHSRRVAQVIGRRAIRDRLLQHAMLSAFRQALLPGQFPAVALYADIDPSELDVNAHPTKSEVRFLEHRRVFRAVEELGERVIAKYGAPAFVPAALPSGDVPTSWSQAPSFLLSHGARISEPLIQSPPTGAPAPQASSLGHELEPQRFVGSLFNTYLAYDLGHELVLVDQHAAHERIRYEALRKRFTRGEAPHSQELLLPEAARFRSEDRATLEARVGWLSRLGFHAEAFGEGSLLFRAVPADWGTHELKTRLQNLIERLLELPAESAELAFDESLFEKLASEACHSSVRAGDRLDRAQALSLVARLFETSHPWNCPHGRPTVVRIPRGRLEEWFQRRV